MNIEYSTKMIFFILTNSGSREMKIKDALISYMSLSTRTKNRTLAKAMESFQTVGNDVMLLFQCDFWKNPLFEMVKSFKRLQILLTKTMRKKKSLILTCSTA